jgi:hypothetical protein
MKRAGKFGNWSMGGLFVAVAIPWGAPGSLAIDPAPTPSLAPMSKMTPNPTIKASSSIWRLFTSDTGGFKVLMPGEAEVSKNDDVTTFQVHRPQEGVVYTVSHVDFESDPTTEKDGIKETFAGTAQGITDEGGKILSTKPLTLGTHPGQELQAKLASGMTSRIRVYIVEKRLYLVIATAKSDRNLTKSIEGYLNSFQLIGR